MKKVIGIFLISMMGAISGVGVYKQFFEEKRFSYNNSNTPAVFSKYEGTSSNFPAFTQAVEAGRPAVVHIRSTFGGTRSRWGGFFDDIGAPEGVGTGSGVIISADGYIATNNHVIENATDIQVTLPDNRNFKATLIGTDPSTDLALLKVEGEDFPYIEMGNSDEIKIGEWVIAIGNPMDLTSTVTAGIVSAKGRDISLLNANYRIESFIQTDAAVNPGNSGGALVDVTGKLVGINTAIASRTGFYAGYSFAVPSAIVRKVMDDLLQFGEVRRGILGIGIKNVDAELAEEQDLATLQGAYVTRVNKGSGADAVGIKEGDVITEINGKSVKSSAELQEQVARFRPGDKVKVSLLRGSEEKKMELTLKKIEEAKDLAAGAEGGNMPLSKEKDREIDLSDNNFRTLSPSEKTTLGLDKGVKVEKVGRKLAMGGIKTGFVITKVNGKPVTGIEMLTDELKNTRGMVRLEGLYEKGMVASYSFNW